MNSCSKKPRIPKAPGLNKAFRRDRRGGVAMILAFTMPAIIGFATVSVDLGSILLASRRLQGVADLAAMSAASDPTNAQADAQSTVTGNPFDAPVTVQVVTGQYLQDPSTPVAQRFTPGGTIPTAARVTLTTTAPLFFGQMLTGRSNVTISRTATAAQAQFASFQIGSGLASLQGGVANALLSGLTGSTVSLSVMNYNALAGVNVDLFQYMSALKTRLSLQGASFSTTLSAQISTGTALSALADALNTQGSTQAAGIIGIIAQAAGPNTPVNLANLFNLGPYAAQDHISAGSGSSIAITALDLVDATLTAAQGGRQVALNLSGAAPGVASLTATLAIGQRPANSSWIAIDDTGAVTVRTAQARLYLDAKVQPSAALLGTAGVALVDVPIYVELAQAQAKLASLSCGPSGNTATLSVSPSVGQISLGSVNTSLLNNFAQAETVSPAALVNLLLLQATAAATVNLGGGTWQPVQFSATDISSGVVKSVQTSNIAQATVASLLTNTRIGVQLLGVNIVLGLGPIQSALGNTLTSVAVPLDQTLNSLTALLGVRLGEADVKINGVRCKGAALVA
jgi:uncharacterized membrane protein